MYPSLALNSLCIWGWPSTSGPLASTCGVLGSQVCGTIPSSYTLLEINPKSLCMQDQHSSHEWHLQAQNSPPTLHANCWPSVTIVGTAGNDSHRCHGDVLSSCLTSCPLKTVPSLPLAPSDRPSAVDGMWALLEFCMDGMMWCIIYCVSLLSLPCIHSAGQFCCFSVWGHELVFLWMGSDDAHFLLTHHRWWNSFKQLGTSTSHGVGPHAPASTGSEGRRGYSWYGSFLLPQLASLRSCAFCTCWCSHLQVRTTLWRTSRRCPAG